MEISMNKYAGKYRIILTGPVSMHTTMQIHRNEGIWNSRSFVSKPCGHMPLIEKPPPV
jgi:hypothetical protein